MTDNKQNITQLFKIDSLNKETRLALDSYAKTKEILNQTNIALGRTVEVKIVNQPSTSNYTIPINERHSTY